LLTIAALGCPGVEDTCDNIRLALTSEPDPWTCGTSEQPVLIGQTSPCGVGPLLVATCLGTMSLDNVSVIGPEADAFVPGELIADGPNRWRVPIEFTPTRPRAHEAALVATGPEDRRVQLSLLGWGPTDDADGDGSLWDVDCDDEDATRYPGAPELCNNVDDDCDGVIPEDELDADADGVATCAGDCDDSNEQVLPGAPEACNGIDDDCVGGVPGDEADGDLDGARICDGDCDDADPGRLPGLTEVPYDGIDQDCDGLDLDDVDGDGSAGPTGSGPDCDDADAEVYPGATEVPGDGVDNDCVNQPPTITEAEITPAAGDRTTSFACAAVGADDTDGNLDTTETTWLVDGVADSALANPLPAETLFRDQLLTCEATATDTDGASASATSAGVLIANALPVIAVSSGVLEEVSPLELVISATDADGDPLVLTAAGLPGTAEFIDVGDGYGRVNWLPAYDAAGSYPLTFTASDGLDVTTLAWTLVVADVDAPPEGMSDCDAVLTVGVEYRCALEGEDADGTAITSWTLLDGPASAWIDPATTELVWTPTAADAGHWDVLLEMSSGPGTGEELYEWQVPAMTLLDSALVDPALGATLSGGGGDGGLVSAELVIPAGVFASPTQVDLYEVIGVQYAPTDTPAVEIVASTPLQGWAVLTLEYNEGFASDGGLQDEEDFGIYTWNASEDEWERVPGSNVDPTTREVTAALPSFSFKSIGSKTRKRLKQKNQLKYLDSGGVFPWTANENNVLVVHGWTDVPRTMAESDIGEFVRDTSAYGGGAVGPRVVYYRYPTGRSILRNAKKLKKILNNKRGSESFFTSGVTFDIIGHSMGGVLARSFSELCHAGDSCSSLNPSTKLGRSQIGQVVSIDSPHRGTDPRALAGTLVTGWGQNLIDPWDLVVLAWNYGWAYDDLQDLPAAAEAAGTWIDWGDAWFNIRGPVATEVADYLSYQATTRSGCETAGAPNLPLKCFPRKRLMTGLSQMLLGMNFFEIGGDPRVEQATLHCVGGTLSANWLTSVAGFSASAVGLGSVFETVWLGDSDLVVPLQSQLGAPDFGGSCAETAQVDGYVHSDSIAKPLNFVVNVLMGNLGLTFTPFNSVVTDWCQFGSLGGDDIGDILNDSTWLGHGPNSCWLSSLFSAASLPDADNDGWPSYPDDCDDYRANVNPGETEVCDGLDNDCNGVFDDNLYCPDDLDGDGYSPYGGDCDDTDNTVYPGAPETSCNGIDNDCDGQVDEGLGCNDDNDNDGWTIGDGDCDDGNDTIYPGASEGCNGIDNDCDGSPSWTEADGDSDGWRICEGDCEDGIPSINPGATEQCDNEDSDCSGGIVDGFPDWDNDFIPDCVDPDDDNDGDPDVTDCADTDPNFGSTVSESCDNLDSNCNGSLVDGFANCDGDSEPNCIDSDDDNDGVPDSADCGNCDPNTGGMNTYYRDADDDGYGWAPTTTQACTRPNGWRVNDDDCNDNYKWIRPGLQMFQLVSVYSSSNQDHMTTLRNPPNFTSAPEYDSVTSSGLYSNASPLILGYSVAVFPPNYTRGSEWVELKRSYSASETDHVTHIAGGNMNSSHPHGGSPNYNVDGLTLGWIRMNDMGNLTRHFQRRYRSDRTNHRMAAQGTSASGNWANDSHSKWVFNADHTCP